MKRFQRGSLTVLLLAILVACGRSDSGTVPSVPILFQLKLKQGATYRTEITFEQTSEREMFGQPMGNASSSRNIISYTVNQIDADGSQHVDATYERMVIASEGFQYDSANPSANQKAELTAPIYDKLIGQKIPIQFASNGEITSITGLDATVESILESLPEGSLREQFRQSMTDNIEQTLRGKNGSLVFFSAQPINV